MPYKISFVMDQIAGHITNYRNLRSVADKDADILADWHEIYYHKSEGKIEFVREKVLPIIPSYVSGVLRGTLEIQRAMHNYRQYDAIWTNASVGLFFTHVYKRVPTLVDFDSTPLQIDRMESYGSGSADPKVIANLKWRLFRNELRSATLLQAWSNWAKQSAITEYDIPAEKIVVNPPGINLQFWHPGTIEKSSQSDNILRVLFVGGDFRRKGGPLLLEWYKGQDPLRCELHIVTREPVEKRPGVYVYHDIEPNSEKLISLYQNSDLFILPSLGECFGIANLEAMGVGLPVIASDVGGIHDIIEPGRNGFIVPSNNLPALTEAISSILDDQNRRQEMGRQSRLLAEQNFDLQSNAMRTFDFLKQIANSKPVTQSAIA